MHERVAQLQPLTLSDHAAETRRLARTGTEPSNVLEYAAPSRLLRVDTAADRRLPAQFQRFSGEHDEPIAAEQYRQLAGTLIGAQADHALKVVMVASAVPGEGKSVTAANLALTLAKSYRRRVLLIDADLRLPSQHDIFGVPATRGLSELLDGCASGLAPTEIAPDLMLLAAGRPSADPVGGLTSSRMASLLEEAAAAFDWVIVDTPPVALLPDAHLLTSMVDGAVLVIQAGVTPYKMIARAVAALGRERILGAVLNGADGRAIKTEYKQYYARH